MLERIEIRNFQVHRRLAIDLDPHVTTIIGPSDVGKSAILRALRWVCLNKPRGDALIRKGAKYANVIVTIGGVHIERYKGAKGNRYIVGDHKFQAVSQSVPPRVGSILKVSETNFQDQHDPPFWIKETPGQRSKLLNQIVNLSSIDQTLARLSAAARRGNVACDLTGTRLKTAIQTKKRLAFSKGLDRRLSELCGLANNLDDTRARRATLSAVIRGVSEHKETLTSRSNEASEGGIVLSKLGSALEAGKRAKSLRSIIRDAANAARLSAVEIPDISTLDPLYLDWLKVSSKRTTLSGLVFVIERQEEDLKAKRLALPKIKGKVCPLCLRPLPM